MHSIQRRRLESVPWTASTNILSRHAAGQVEESRTLPPARDTMMMPLLGDLSGMIDGRGRSQPRDWATGAGPLGGPARSARM
jgi:hypothetical protein